MSEAEGQLPEGSPDTELFCKSVKCHRAYDATSLRTLMECPRKFQLSRIEGWNTPGEKVDLEFGKFYHDCVELFDRRLAEGQPKSEALDQAYALALGLTWIDGAAWGGQHVRVWRCNNWSTRRDKNGKTVNRYKCPAAKGWWLNESGFERACPKCNEGISCRTSYIPGVANGYKNRHSLLRAVFEYCDTQPETGGVKPVVFPDGQIGLEHSFRIAMDGFLNPDDEAYLLCGHLDSFVDDGLGMNCTRERKTTKTTVTGWFFDRYSPDVQIDMYDLASWLLYSDTLDLSAVMIEVMQIAKNFCRLQRGYAYRSEGQREETLRDFKFWIKQAEQMAKDGYYPKNTAACNAYGRACQFRGVCANDPADRSAMLDDPTKFVRDLWNPLEER